MLRVLRPGGRVAISDMVLQAPVPEPLQGLFGRVLCIGGARDRDGYRELLEGAGLQAFRAYDESPVLSEMLAQNEARLAVAGDLVDTPGVEDLGPVLAAARDFVPPGDSGTPCSSAAPRGRHEKRGCAERNPFWILAVG